MVTFPLSPPAGRMIRLPTRTEARAMFNRPSVMITAIIAAGLVLVVAIGGIVYLASSGKSTDAIGVLILGVVGVLWGKLRKIETQTNGTTSKLVDHTIAQAQQATDIAAAKATELA